MTEVGSIGAMWRHPVKSLQGEQLERAVVESDGLRGDRRWGIRDGATGRILTGRREPMLLLAAASLVGAGAGAGDGDGDGDGEPEITLPDGTVVRGEGASTDEALSTWLGRPVALVPAGETPPGRAEFFADALDDGSEPIEWTMPPGRFVDAMALLVLTTASLRTGAALHPAGDWHPRRFRPNLLVDVAAEGWVEDGWCGRSLRVRDVELLPQAPCARCTMVTRPQPDLERDLDIFKTVARHHDSTFGAWTMVGSPGTIRVGDAVELVP